VPGGWDGPFGCCVCDEAIPTVTRAAISQGTSPPRTIALKKFKTHICNLFRSCQFCQIILFFTGRDIGKTRSNLNRPACNTTEPIINIPGRDFHEPGAAFSYSAAQGWKREYHDYQSWIWIRSVATLYQCLVEPYTVFGPPLALSGRSRRAAWQSSAHVNALAPSQIIWLSTLATLKCRREVFELIHLPLMSQSYPQVGDEGQSGLQFPQPDETPFTNAARNSKQTARR